MLFDSTTSLVKTIYFYDTLLIDTLQQIELAENIVFMTTFMTLKQVYH
jgi:hypothetical protein